MRIAIVNGPNLNLLGIREPQLYGQNTIEQYLHDLRAQFSHIDISYFQSNIEGEIIDILHQVGFSYNGIVLNAGAYTHTSVAIGDAVAAIDTPVIEVHISNVFAREDFRHVSYISGKSIGVISGFGLDSYTLALVQFISRFN